MCPCLSSRSSDVGNVLPETVGLSDWWPSGGSSSSNEPQSTAAPKTVVRVGNFSWAETEAQFIVPLKLLERTKLKMIDSFKTDEFSTNFNILDATGVIPIKIKYKKDFRPDLEYGIPSSVFGNNGPTQPITITGLSGSKLLKIKPFHGVTPEIFIGGKIINQELYRSGNSSAFDLDLESRFQKKTTPSAANFSFKPCKGTSGNPEEGANPPVGLNNSENQQTGAIPPAASNLSESRALFGSTPDAPPKSKDFDEVDGAQRVFGTFVKSTTTDVGGIPEKAANMNTEKEKNSVFDASHLSPIDSASKNAPKIVNAKEVFAKNSTETVPMKPVLSASGGIACGDNTNGLEKSKDSATENAPKNANEKTEKNPNETVRETPDNFSAIRWVKNGNTTEIEGVEKAKGIVSASLEDGEIGDEGEAPENVNQIMEEAEPQNSPSALAEQTFEQGKNMPTDKTSFQQRKKRTIKKVQDLRPPQPPF
ncbi:unnamed protein product [Caenorhabditis auriculariae]|uniref:Uncharacterized protein n=1 Tax=Caenorhabditis auriculariae TaxID=2777116 RepID=A0A8S1H238_9PELO|nr:unnamed protein product [Caenorhabditis auriculariae]